MPFNINNVDVTVSANVIFGVTSAVLTGLLPPSVLDDLDLQVISLLCARSVCFMLFC